ncbi:hypothetical protein [Spiroplasma endosymbiont of Phycita roborella]|uniref:hypothetical protein n=1 Tax=Spiroplasma endosymbiont of Phycita roborella TaxID=3066311 RepID=UPI00313DB872
MKTWIKTNFYKITSILALVLATTGLIIGSIAQNKTNGYQSFLGHDYTVYWGGLEQQYEKLKIYMMKIK